MWTTKYIISQIFIVLAICAVVPSFFVRDKRKVLVLGMINTLCYFTHYFLLGSATGALINIAAVSRITWFYIDNRRGVEHNYWSLTICVLIAIGFGVLGFRHWYDFMSIVASVNLTFAYWQSNLRLYTIISFINSIIWVIYGICYKSIFAVVAELVIIIFELIRIFKMKKDRV